MVVAQVPVYDLSGEVVGVASVGRDVPSVWTRLGEVAPNLLVYLGVASVLGVGGSLLLSRRVKRQTLGMEPAEIVGLVEHREALVHGVKEGVIALDRDGRVTVANDSARDLLRLPHDAVGRRLEELHLDPQLVEVLSSRQTGSDRLVLVGDRVLALNRRPMRSHGTVIGSVTTLRDRTELSALERELGTTRATSNTLRAQTHEFANQLHTISGLLHLEEYDEVVRFVDGVRLGRTSLYDEVTSRIADATVAALLIAKTSLAGEGGVELRLLPEPSLTKVYGALSRDLATVVGNLVDNALDAAAQTPEGRTPGSTCWSTATTTASPCAWPTAGPACPTATRSSGRAGRPSRSQAMEAAASAWRWCGSCAGAAAGTSRCATTVGPCLLRRFPSARPTTRRPTTGRPTTRRPGRPQRSGR